MKKNFAIIVLTVIAGLTLQCVIYFFSWCNDLYKENYILKKANRELKEENKRLSSTVEDFDNTYHREFKIENSYKPLTK